MFCIALLASPAPVSVASGADHLRVAGASARPGETGVPIRIEATSDQPVEAFSVSFWFPAGDLAVTDVTSSGTAIEALAPEFFDVSVDPATGHVGTGVIFEVSEPYDGVALLPSPAVLQELLKVVFDVSAGTRPGLLALHLADGPGQFPIRNVFSIQGSSVLPTLEDGTLEVLPRPFRRGFVNPDPRVDISDAIYLLSYIFLGGPPPGCMAAADSNGDRRADVSDVVWLLGWIFKGTAPPPEPFAECGDDPRGPSQLSCLEAGVCP